MHNPILKNIIEEKPLSERELEVGNLLAAGLSDNEIARKLSITPDTVKFQLKNIWFIPAPIPIPIKRQNILPFAFLLTARWAQSIRYKKNYWSQQMLKITWNTLILKD
jgi:hypothetical protein